MSLRETKKARTRKLISDLAFALFQEKGFSSVTVAEIAARAEVGVTTVFNYFPTKESIIFDLEDEIDAELIAAIRERKTGQAILDSLLQYFLAGPLIDPPSKKKTAEFMALVKSAPELTSYFRSMWDRYAKTLAKEIHLDSGVGKMESDCLASLVLESVFTACNSSAPKDSLTFSFRILKKGWPL